jgi:hypothetical protein
MIKLKFKKNMGCRHEMVAHKYKYPRMSYG